MRPGAARGRIVRARALRSVVALLGAIACTGELSGSGDSSGDSPSEPTSTSCVAPGEDPRSIARGACAVIKRGCNNCHEPSDPSLGTLSGQDTARLGTSAYPANLTPDPETGIGTWTNDQIVRAIQSGLDAQDKALCFTMTRFDRMGDDEAYAIAHYLKSLPPVHRVIPESSCPPVKPTPDAGSDAASGAAGSEP